MATTLPAYDPLGTDLHLDESGDLTSTVSGSLELVTGVANAAQAARINLQTNTYSYLWGTSVGSKLGEYIDQPLTESVLQQIRNLVVETISQDPRILGVQGVEFDLTDPKALQVTVHAVVAAFGSVQLPFRIGR
ncbi:hypothetical protein [Tumebacillus flagellatus]|uniref:Uncharacterized protein n=1 Tax=Tumebacillus flagellatus TaxID=1157490 RepID=A0A074M821_9BACL|nr:hypothetical protein [Tumebacillus flagellatus]KEO82097.1 hypothetical protein EL26_17460 [Tumebacillus flagellatus]